MSDEKKDNRSSINVNFQVSEEWIRRVDATLENLHDTDLELDLTRLTRSTLLRLAVLEGLPILEKKYLKTKRSDAN
jgi:hypothetical protein